jgi:hypothetical protein
VLHTFVGDYAQPEELSVFEGDQVEVLEEADGWMLVRDGGGREGLVPTSYLQLDELYQQVGRHTGAASRGGWVGGWAGIRWGAACLGGEQSRKWLRRGQADRYKGACAKGCGTQTHPPPRPVPVLCLSPQPPPPPPVAAEQKLQSQAEAEAAAAAAEYQRKAAGTPTRAHRRGASVDWGQQSKEDLLDNIFSSYGGGCVCVCGKGGRGLPHAVLAGGRPGHSGDLANLWVLCNSQACGGRVWAMRPASTAAAKVEGGRSVHAGVLAPQSLCSHSFHRPPLPPTSHPHALQPTPSPCPPCPRSSPPASQSPPHSWVAAPAAAATRRAPRLEAARWPRWRSRTRSRGPLRARVGGGVWEEGLPAGLPRGCAIALFRPGHVSSVWTALHRSGGQCPTGTVLAPGCCCTGRPCALPSRLPADSVWASQPLRQDTLSRSSEQYGEAPAGTSPRSAAARQLSGVGCDACAPCASHRPAANPLCSFSSWY